MATYSHAVAGAASPRDEEERDEAGRQPAAGSRRPTAIGERNSETRRETRDGGAQLRARVTDRAAPAPARRVSAAL